MGDANRRLDSRAMALSARRMRRSGNSDCAAAQALVAVARGPPSPPRARADAARTCRRRTSRRPVLESSPKCQAPPSSASMKTGVAGDHADRQAAADDLAVAGEVGLHAEEGLRAARMDAEAGDDLVEDERRAGLRGDVPHLVQELARLQVRPPALHRLDQHRRELVGIVRGSSQSDSGVP